MPIITTVEELIQRLEHSHPGDFAKVIKKIAIPKQAFESLSYWSDKSYTRNCLGRNCHFELILLCWNQDAITPIHDHGGQKCWVYQVDGQVAEIRYDKNKSGELYESFRTVLSPGKLTYMEDRMGYHALKNETAGRAMTLHIYVSPIHSCGVFNEEKGTFESKTMSYDSIPEIVTEELV